MPMMEVIDMPDHMKQQTIGYVLEQMQQRVMMNIYIELLEYLEIM